MTFYTVDGVLTGDVMTVKLHTLRTRMFGLDQSAGVFIVSAEGRGANATIAAFVADAGPIEPRMMSLIATAQGR